MEGVVVTFRGDESHDDGGRCGGALQQDGGQHPDHQAGHRVGQHLAVTECLTGGASCQPSHLLVSSADVMSVMSCVVS